MTEGAEETIDDIRRERDALRAYKAIVELQMGGARSALRHVVLGSELSSAMEAWLRAVVRGVVGPKENAELLAAVFRRFVRVGMFAFVVGVTPSVLMFWQNLIMRDQNEFLREQILEMRAQSRATSAQANDARRSTNLAAVSDVMRDLSALPAAEPIPHELDLRIYATSEALVPDSAPVSLFRRRDQALMPELLTAAPDRLISPQRGSLLIALYGRMLKSKDARLSYNLESAFVPTDTALDGIHLSGARIANIYADFAHFTAGDLSAADAAGASLRYARLDDARLMDVDFDDADLMLADLSGSDLAGASFVDAKLEGADLRKTEGLTAEQLCAASALRGATADAELENALCALCANKVTRGRDPSAGKSGGSGDGIVCPSP